LEHVQTKHEIEALLAAAGLRPRKRFGQHFLIDGNLMRRLVESAELTSDDVVLEVGPGTGGLTDLLVSRARHVICVEIDRDLFALLSERFRDSSNIELICTDALAGKHELNPQVVSALDKWAIKNPLKLVANLPYDIATPLLMNLLMDAPAMRRFCFTVQAEVGERISAPHGSKIYGPLSIVAQTLSRVEQIARIGPQSFWPRPMVDSVMLRMDRIEPPLYSSAEARRFAQFVHGVFEHRRKTLRAALGYVVDEPTRERICSAVDSKLRPEQIARAQWTQLFQMIQ
jgi:16S rRNA (adenine1518-N6/adenine1519-N6)-dimethyltransferase